MEQKTTTLLLGLIAGCFLLALTAMTGNASNMLSGEGKARGVVASFYSGTERTPSVVVRVDSIFTDYERKGFFRIGVLPMGVMEGFTLEVRHSKSITNSLAQTLRWINARAGKRLEFRKIKIFTEAGCRCQLASSQARIVSDGRLELFGRVQFFSGTNAITTSHALLQITGPQTGELILATSPPSTNHLFALIEPTIPNQKETP